jgi:glyceraldehyde-3-phosphate dehydrogenase (NADP+)
MSNTEEFQIKTLLNQDTYLVNGLKNGKVKHQQCSQRFHQRKKYEPTILGSIHLWEKKKAWRQSMPLTRFNNGQEYGPP